MNDIVLQACRYRDLDQVLTLEMTAFPVGPYSRLDFVYFLGRARGGFTIANKDGHVLGYVIAMGERGVGIIQSIAVSPEFRGMGIGKALMKSAVDHLANYERIYLLVDSNNVAAIALYHRFSFRETGKIIRGYYRNGDDAVEMVRTRAAAGDQMAE